jgi:hypothetical protein
VCGNRRVATHLDETHGYCDPSSNLRNIPFTELSVVKVKDLNSQLIPL